MEESLTGFESQQALKPLLSIGQTEELTYSSLQERLGRCIYPLHDECEPY